MLLALLCSRGLVALDALGIHVSTGVEALLRAVDFDEALLHGMRGFLLFAGALQPGARPAERHHLRHRVLFDPGAGTQHPSVPRACIFGRVAKLLS